MNKTTILIVDDHTLIRESWSFILNTHPGFSVVGECGAAEEAIELVTILQPHIVILDINLPRMNGIDATEQLRTCSPGTRVLGVSMHNHPTYARKMIGQGAMGFITKNAPREEMIHAIKEIRAGKKYIGQEIKDLLAEQVISGDSANEALGTLTGRELQIISRIMRGETSREISEALGLSLRTVEVHRHNILRKLGQKNTAALINYINKSRLELI